MKGKDMTRRGWFWPMAAGLLVVTAGSPAAAAAEPGTLAGASSLSCTPQAPAAATGPYQKDIKFRSDFGLPTDVTHIVAARQAPGSGSVPTYGVALSKQELAEVQFEVGPLESAQRADSLKAYLAAHKNTFAGLYLDHTRGGRTVIRFTRDVDARRLELRHLFKLPDRLIVEAAPTSYADLESLKDSIVQNMIARRVGTAEIIGVGVDVPNDVVFVTVTNCETDLLAAISQRYAAKTVSVRAGEMSRALGQFQYRDAPPFKGGQFIESFLVQLGFVYSCTAGFVVQKGSLPTQYYVLTAGHCGGGWGATGSAWDQAGFAMGQMTNNNYHNNTSADASLISISATPSNHVFAAPCTCGPDLQYSISSQEGQDADNVGELVCLSGSGVGSLGITCGNLQAKNLTMTLTDPDVPGGQTTVNWLRQLGFGAHSGDSGGSMFNNQTGVAQGTATAGNSSQTFYNHIFDDTNGFGVTVDTTPSAVG